MITLTTPSQINSILGGNAPVQYDRFILSSIVYDVVSQQVSASIRLTSTAQPDMQPISGTLTILCATNLLTISVPQLDFYRQIRLTTGQNDSVKGYITSAQNNLESGLVGLGVVAGNQTTGV